MTTTAERAPGAPRRGVRFWRRYGAGYLFVLPSMVFFVLFMFLPLGWSFVISFQRSGLAQSSWIGLDNYVSLLNDPVFGQAAFFVLFMFRPLGWSFVISFQRSGLAQSSWIGLDNYVSLLNDPVFGQAAFNTVLYSVVTVAVWVLVSMVLATLIHPLPPRLRTFFRAAYYLPSVTSAVFVALVWRWVFNANPWGLANYVLSLFGAGPLGFLSDPSPFLGANVALWSVILSSVLTIPAVGVVLYLSIITIRRCR